MTSQLTDSDRAALRARYRTERDKRLRQDGNNQYLEATGRYANLLDDPYTPVVPRAPLHTDVQVLVIGAGFAGLVIGARLKQAGISDVRLIDKAGDVGGVWYWNRYPGAMCDTAAMVYLPLLEETGTVPSAKYVPAPEIQAHARRIADTFDLRRDALLSTGVETIAWTSRSRATSCTPIVVTCCVPSMCAQAPGRCICPNCQASRAFTRLLATRFTPVAGTTHIRVVTRPVH